MTGDRPNGRCQQYFRGAWGNGTTRGCWERMEIGSVGVGDWLKWQ